MTYIRPFIVFSWISFSASFLVAASYDVSSPPGKSQVRFHSKASLEDFDGTAEQIYGTVNVDFSQAQLNLQGQFSVPVMSMQTGLSLRDKHMMSSEWLDEKKFPSIQFELANASDQKVKKLSEHEWFIKAKGNWTMKGVVKEIEIPVTLKTNPKTPDVIGLTSRFKLHLDDFGIRGPAGMRMLGAKVSPDVDVILNLVGVAQSGWGKSKPKKR